MRSRSLVPLVLAVLVSCASAPQQYMQKRHKEHLLPPERLALEGRQVTFAAGLRSFDDDAFGDLEDQPVIAVDYLEPMGVRWLRLEGGLHYSFDAADGTRASGEDVRLHGQSFEISTGVNSCVVVGRFRPYVGVGAAFLFLNLHGLDEENDVVFDDDEVTVGGYAKAGLLFQVTRTSHIGFEMRHFEGGEAELDQTRVDSDYDQLVFVFGTSFE